MLIISISSRESNIFASPRGNCVIVKFRVSLNLSRNIIRGVGNMHLITLENVWMCACVRACVRVGLWVGAWV